MSVLKLDQNEVDIIQKAHAKVQILEEMYSDNSKDDDLRGKILADLADAKLDFERAKEEYVVSKIPSNAEWSLDYATAVVTYK